MTSASLFSYSFLATAAIIFFASAGIPMFMLIQLVGNMMGDVQNQLPLDFISNTSREYYLETRTIYLQEMEEMMKAADLGYIIAVVLTSLSVFIYMSAGIVDRYHAPLVVLVFLIIHYVSTYEIVPLILDTWLDVKMSIVYESLYFEKGLNLWKILPAIAGAIGLAVNIFRTKGPDSGGILR